MKRRSTATEAGTQAWQELGSDLPEPADAAERSDLLWQEVVAHFRWYDKSATNSRLAYQGLKLVTLLLGGAVTVLAAIGSPAAVTASLAAAIVASEGIQQLFQLQTNWILYRAGAESLRHHAFLYAARAQPYDDPTTRRDRLADTLRTITTTENTKWTRTMQTPRAEQ